MRIDVRSVNTETSQIEYVETIDGKAERMLTMVGELGVKINTGLKLAQTPMRVPVIQASAPSGGGQLRAMLLMSRALEQQDRGNAQGAIALYKSALEAYPQLERAKVLLASLEGSSDKQR
jgi:curli biogenesis system outer membrane secretion channel CsgG